jgi:hypothetical protein
LNQRHDLLECFLTCQEWNSPALEELYETVYLDDFDDDESAADLIERITYHPLEIAKMVTEIDLREDLVERFEDGQRPLKNLCTMYNYCPNIKIIHCRFFNHEEPFWKLTLEATRKGKLKNLEVIPNSVRTPELFETHYSPIV